MSSPRTIHYDKFVVTPAKLEEAAIAVNPDGFTLLKYEGDTHVGSLQSRVAYYKRGNDLIALFLDVSLGHGGEVIGVASKGMRSASGVQVSTVDELYRKSTECIARIHKVVPSYPKDRIILSHEVDKFVKVMACSGAEELIRARNFVLRVVSEMNFELTY